MADDELTILSACGRRVGPEEIRHIREVARLCTGLSRRELALTLCEHWGWFGATGKPLVRSCYKVLSRLVEQGLVDLPAKRKAPARPARSAAMPLVAQELIATRPAVACDLGAVQPVRLERVEGREATALCNALFGRYHPLGYKSPFGCSLRYFITSSHGRLGCLLLASGARALRCRDEWVGWSAEQRLRNIPYVVNNSRFLLLPWVNIPHVASHVLGQLARQVQQDWHARWNYRPVLMETFVDPTRHRGICYRAAGWIVLVETTGRGLQLRGHSYRTNRKLVLVRPLLRDFRARLLSGTQPRSSIP